MNRINDALKRVKDTAECEYPQGFKNGVEAWEIFIHEARCDVEDFAKALAEINILHAPIGIMANMSVIPLPYYCFTCRVPSPCPTRQILDELEGK